MLLTALSSKSWGCSPWRVRIASSTSAWKSGGSIWQGAFGEPAAMRAQLADSGGSGVGPADGVATGLVGIVGPVPLAALPPPPPQ